MLLLQIAGAVAAGSIMGAPAEIPQEALPLLPAGISLTNADASPRDPRESRKPSVAAAIEARDVAAVLEAGGTPLDVFDAINGLEMGRRLSETIRATGYRYVRMNDGKLALAVTSPEGCCGVFSAPALANYTPPGPVPTMRELMVEVQGPPPQ